MRAPWWERFAMLVCRIFGHDLYGTPLMNGARWCRRCHMAFASRRPR